MMLFQWQGVGRLWVFFSGGSYFACVCDGEGAAIVHILRGGAKWRRGLRVLSVGEVILRVL